MVKRLLITGIIFLFIFSFVAPIPIGFTIKKTVGRELAKTVIDDFGLYYFDKYDFPESYSSEKCRIKLQNFLKISTVSALIEKEPIQTVTYDDLMDSPWPMQGHDNRHTGHSSYSTTNNPGHEKWCFITEDDYIDSGIVIDSDGIIYFGGGYDDLPYYLYALYPNGTMKWKVRLGNLVCTFGISPAIDESGVIYVPCNDGLYAINPNGTIKWRYKCYVESSPTIAEEGTIYFTHSGRSPPYNGKIIAVYPNGTLKWDFKTNHMVHSSPAIGLDGTVYAGSHDTYVYALYPNNGTLKWKFKTEFWVHGSPTIGNDGTVYIGSDDKYLYALFPNNGTMKWKLQVGSMRCSPSLDDEGTLYFGVWNYGFKAIYPNGTLKWSFDPGNKSGVWGSTAAISADGTIYFGSCIDIFYCGGGEIIALWLDGTLKWRKKISHYWVDSSPAIAEDGTVYIGSAYSLSYGILHAFGELDSNAPSRPEISGPINGKAGTEYEYIIKSISPLGRKLYYHIDWGDRIKTSFIGPYRSGEKIIIHNSWQNSGPYKITVRVKDTENLWGPWSELTVTMSRNRATFNPFLLRFFDMFPIMQRILGYIL